MDKIIMAVIGLALICGVAYAADHLGLVDVPFIGAPTSPLPAPTLSELEARASEAVKAASEARKNAAEAASAASAAAAVAEKATADFQSALLGRLKEKRGEGQPKG